LHGRPREQFPDVQSNNSELNRRAPLAVMWTSRCGALEADESRARRGLITMDNAEAREILERELATYRARSYDDLVKLFGQPINTEVVAASGVKYQLEIQVLWDGQPGRNLRVLGSVDDGRWRSFLPLTSSFIVAPDGSFVGE
jgi:hypothetical protein